MNHAHGSGMFGGHYAGSGECAGPLCRGDRWVTSIGALAQFRHSPSRLFVFILHRRGGKVPLMRRRLIGRARTVANASGAAVVTDSIHGDVVDYSPVVDVRNVRRGYIVHGAVIVHMPAPPVAALVPLAAIAITIIDSAVESHARSPVTGMP